MEQSLIDVFEQARGLVAEADRKLAEEEERRRTREREAKMQELATRVDAAFDFTSKEKLELDPRMDLQDGKVAMEFVLRSLRAIFVLVEQNDAEWSLSVTEDGRQPQTLATVRGGSRQETASRRLAAARVVTAIGNWAQKIPASAAKPAAQNSQPQARWKDAPPAERREPTYGTMGKFLGY